MCEHSVSEAGGKTFEQTQPFAVMFRIKEIVMNVVRSQKIDLTYWKIAFMSMFCISQNVSPVFHAKQSIVDMCNAQVRLVIKFRSYS